MSIDSAAKRRSAACVKPIAKAPIPDGTIGASDRLHIAWMYSGIAVYEAPAPTLRHQLYMEAWPLVPDDKIDFVDEDISFGG